MDRCGGCSAMFRGMHARPQAAHCRRRMEKLLDGDERITRAKVRLAAGARKRGPDNKADGETEDDKQDTMEGIFVEEPEGEKKEKRRRLEGIEEEAMRTEDMQKLGELYTEYMIEQDRL